MFYTLDESVESITEHLERYQRYCQECDITTEKKALKLLTLIIPKVFGKAKEDIEPNYISKNQICRSRVKANYIVL